MTHASFDDELRRAFDQLAEQLRRELNDRLNTIADELTASARADRDAAAQDASTAAQRHAEQALAARDEAQRALAAAQAKIAETDARNADAETRIAEAAAREDAAIARANAAAAQAAAREEAVAAAVAAREEAVAAAAAAREEAAAAQAAAAADAAAREQAAIARTAAAVSDALERGRAEGREAARAATPAPPVGDTNTAERLLDGCRAIDRARSLSEILDTVVSCAGREASRAALLLVRGDTVRGWRFIGFDRGFDDAQAVQFPLDDGGVVAHAVRSRTAASGDAAGDAPRFARDGAGRGTFAIPLLLSGQVIAVVYADQDQSGRGRRPAWTATLEVLARHASRMLEALTALRTAQAMASDDGGREAGTNARRPGSTDDDDAAKRYARLLVSEIKLYHEDAVAAGRRDGDLKARLGGEIARARVLYEQRVPSSIPGAAQLFNDELIRTLADGDASLL